MLAIHLGVSSGGRTSHLRYGYSQIANPRYLRKKKVLTLRQQLRLILRAIIANASRATIKPTEREWRMSRLSGNLRALRDLASGEIHPRKVLQLD
jgi:hypothetical protein